MKAKPFVLFPHSLSRLATALTSLVTAWLLVGASAASALDHFNGYPIAGGTGIDGPIVTIADQFGVQATDLGLPTRFLVPADKNGEGLSDFFSHLTCYDISDGAAGPAVISTNQFGQQILTLGTPDSLCVPTEKLIAPGPVNIDHYKCYEASGNPIGIGVTLQDQFGFTVGSVLDPRLFCTPTDKNGEGILDPVSQMTCYDVTPPGVAPGLIPILNQFLAAPDLIDLGPADTLCVPSTVQPLPAAPMIPPVGLGALTLGMVGTALMLIRRKRLR